MNLGLQRLQKKKILIVLFTGTTTVNFKALGRSEAVSRMSSTRQQIAGPLVALR